VGESSSPFFLPCRTYMGGKCNGNYGVGSVYVHDYFQAIVQLEFFESYVEVCLGVLALRSSTGEE